ncbi:Haemolysin XhlA [Yoonia tamlensis]|uniref:Haemolysin XhlA n=1 Tax=Yoonia tamlensis TaxID=390270 RepID=A0A1I6G5J3_9RHOB|nr:hemolysin XhlA family protein [Yoonia tamlensis]SFR37469.1 Haemolysin XhlA [Yoonia tamlensis]
MDRTWFDKVEQRLGMIETRNAVDEVHRDNVSDRLGAIEDTLKWLVRLVIGGFLMGALTYALQGGFRL